jgi:hypothetical protein
MANDHFFTDEALTAADLAAPPVTACRCTYCTRARAKYAICPGDPSARNHRLVLGDERHNPENLARLTLRDVLPAKLFDAYVSAPGGHHFLVKGTSGLSYAVGRRTRFPTHFIRAYHDRQYAADLCIVLKKSAPLATMVLAYYCLITSDEEQVWSGSHVVYAVFDRVPEPFQHYLITHGVAGGRVTPVTSPEQAERYWNG